MCPTSSWPTGLSSDRILRKAESGKTRSTRDGSKICWNPLNGSELELFVFCDDNQCAVGLSVDNLSSAVVPFDVVTVKN